VQDLSLDAVIIINDANKLERIQQKFAAPCFNRFLPQVHYSYALALEQLSFTPNARGGIISMHCPLFEFTLTLNSALVFETVSLRV
jgi:hypothetical protein